MINGLDFPHEPEFRLWLSMNDPNEVLARDWGWFGCPIGMFLEAYGLEPTVYRDGTWSPYREEQYFPGYPMPPWAQEFVWLCDLMKPRVMTFKDCIDLLDNPLFRPEHWASGKIRHPIRTLD